MIGLNKTLATFVGLARASVNEWPRAEPQVLPANHYATADEPDYRINPNFETIKEDNGCASLLALQAVPPPGPTSTSYSFQE